ncbi:MAG: trimethylamine methyltransferase family protein [Candidatus Hydrogenedentes bacterium]|nr:trimethylamine methyltransferase family protein [Candidatus Hydrogenedentota bacterium]
MKLAALSVLSDSEIERIHDASIDILEQVGIKVGSGRMRAFLKERGLPVDDKSGVVRITRGCIEDCVSRVPPRFEVFDREGRPLFTLGDGVPRIAAGHNAVFWVDSDTGATRPSTVADVEQFARLCEGLSDIDVIGIPVMPQNVPDPRATLLYGVRACIANSRKPIFFSTDRPEINRAIMEMLDAAFAGDLHTQAYGIGQLSPTSPLFWEASVLDALEDTVRFGVPLAILPEPNAGVSCPYTLAGLITMDNAEWLSGMVMTQLLRPGAPIMYANSWTMTDMRNGCALVGSAETTVCRIAGAQLARRYHVPSHTTAPNSDNHAHDEQNAWEKALSQFCAVAAGNDLIVNCGMFATGMTCSHEQLLMDEEMSAIVRRIACGIQVGDATIAKDTIIELGPHNPAYLTAPHTLEWLHSDEYVAPRLSVRCPRAVWEAAGAKDTYQVARDRVRMFAQEPPAAQLDQKRLCAVEAIVAQSAQTFRREK